MNRQFKRILSLVKKTGDRLIVTDPDGNESYVVMDLDQYEGLLGLGWDDDDDFGDWEGPQGPTWSPEDDGDLVNLDDLDKTAADVGMTEVSQPSAEMTNGEASSLPPAEDIRKAVEHDLAILESWQSEKETDQKPEVEKKPEGEQKIDPDEERFYLEPIE